MESILITIKHLIGFEEDYIPFDLNIITGINMAISTLTQLGVTPKTPNFRVHSPNDCWDDYLDDSSYMDLIKDYIFIKTKYVFDPPASSSVMTALENEIKELEWRIHIEVDKGETNAESV